MEELDNIGDLNPKELCALLSYYTLRQTGDKFPKVVIDKIKKFDQFLHRQSITSKKYFTIQMIDKIESKLEEFNEFIDTSHKPYSNS